MFVQDINKYMTIKYKPTKNDFIRVYNTMALHKRKTAFIDVTEDEVLRVFDSNPYINGVSAMEVTIEEIAFYIKEFDFINE